MVVPQGSYILLIIFLLRGLNAEPREFRLELEYQIALCKPVKSDCKESLEAIAANITEGANVRIDIKKNHLYLNETARFSGLNSLLISGNPDSSTVINCSLSIDAGITLETIANLTLKNLTLTSCGAQFTLRKKIYSSALRLMNCSDVNVEYLAITDSKGIGLTIQSHIGGRLLVAWSNFTENRLPSELEEKNISGGGGVYIGEFLHDSNLSVSFEFEHCWFERNIAHTRHFESYYSDEFGQNRTGYGQGGGMFLAIENDIIHSSVNVHIIDCTYTKNEAFRGGGLSTKIGRARISSMTKITTIEITIENSKFESNGCNKSNNTRIGGGAHLSYNSLSIATAEGIKYSLNNVKFIENCAELGGGVFVLSTRFNSTDNSIVFDNCQFENNRAHTGSAIDLIPSSFVTTTGYTLIPVFRNCTFLENVVIINSDLDSGQMTAGIGTLYATLYSIQFEGTNYFMNNTGTALYMVNSIANFSDSNAFFCSNQGERGGAIALIGASAFFVGPEKEYNFTSNRSTRGGALYVLLINNHDFTISQSCFIQFFNGKRTTLTGSWNTTINFINNTAQIGKAVYATSLHPCQSININADNNPFYITVDTSEVFTIRGIDIDNDKVATAGAHLYHQHDKALPIIPGQWYKHDVSIMDDMNNTVNEPLRKIITNTDDCTEILNLDDNTTYVRNKVKLLDRSERVVNLCLYTVSTRESYTRMKVELQECPPGFKLENQECICDSSDYYGLLRCDKDYHSLLTLGLWAGFIDNELVTSICPRRFCTYNSSQTMNKSIVSAVILPQNKTELNEAVCGKTRKGVLCGECAKDYTTYFHSPNFMCGLAHHTLCKVGWLFYILSELMPVTVVFITVLALNISFTSGAVNGFILFSQILLSLNIDASGIIKFSRQKQVMEGYQFLYGFLNLDFFSIDTLAFCLWPNATALDMLAFKYITIVYALSLVILAIWFMNKCGARCLGKWWRITTVKLSVIHGISAFLIICYSQSIMVSSRLLNGVELWRKVSSTDGLHWRVWQNGNLLYFKGRHLLYALPALICWITIGILPPILLISYPLLNKMLAFFGCEESKLVHLVSRKLPISSLKPLLDSFQGCFKDNLRFFAGLYFVYRWTAPLVNATTSSFGTAYILSEVLLIIMLALHALFQPYQQRVHNVIDTLLFTDLVLINSITVYHYHLFQSQESGHTIERNVSIAAGFQMTLIYLPLLIVIFYMLAVGCKRVYYLYSKNHGSPNQEEMDNLKPGTQSFRRLRAAVRSISSLSGDINANDEELPHRFIAGEVSYECFEDTDYAQEMPTDNKSMQDIVTY